MDRTAQNKTYSGDIDHQQESPTVKLRRRGARNQVYFVKSGDFVKIGYASHVPTRFSGIKTSTPYDLELLGTVPGSKETEAAFHERFRRHHHRGEWFHFHHEIEAAIAQLGIYLRPPNKTEVAAVLEDPYDVGARLAAENAGYRLARIKPSR